MRVEASIVERLRVPESEYGFGGSGLRVQVKTGT